MKKKPETLIKAIFGTKDFYLSVLTTTPGRRMYPQMEWKEDRVEATRFVEFDNCLAWLKWVITTACISVTIDKLD